MLNNNAVVGSLLENLDHIEIIFKETHEPFKNDRGNTGDSKEYSIVEFISAYLTSEYRVEKGCIYNTTQHSQNIDCVILAPNHPKLITPKRKIILAEGVFAAIEVKPTILNRSEFDRAINQIKSVKNLSRQTFIPDLSCITCNPPREEYEKRIPGIIFSKESLKPDDLFEHLKKKLKDGEITVYELPDIIFTLDNGLYILSPDITKKPGGEYFIEKRPDFSKTTMIHFCEADKSESLALFLFYFLSLPSPVMLVNEFIIKIYLEDFDQLAMCGYDFKN